MSYRLGSVCTKSIYTININNMRLKSLKYVLNMHLKYIYFFFHFLNV